MSQSSLQEKIARLRPIRPKKILELDRVLIVRLSSLGDVVCTLPAAGVIRAQFPEVKISWAVDPRFSAIVKNCRFVDEVIETKGTPLGKARQSVHQRYDAVLDMQGLAKSAWLALAAQSKTKLGYHWQREGSWLVSEKVLPDPSSLHVVDQYIDVARELVVRAGAIETDHDEYEFGLVPSDQDLNSVHTKLMEAGVTGAFAVMNPGGAWATKQWKPESFAHVAKSLEELKVQSVVIGSKSPAEALGFEKLKAEAERIGARPVSLVGQTSIGELVALISRSKLHLGGDTGSTHIAAALSIPAVGLYSITKPIRSCPYRQMGHCLYNPMRLDLISPEEVINKIKDVLK